MNRNHYFKDKTVWIIGASSGIGWACARQLHLCGARLILSARSTDVLLQLQTDLKDNQHIVLQVDLTQTENINFKVDQLIEQVGHIDLVIQSGGISQRAECSETPMEVERKIMEVNYFGNIALTKALVPYFEARKSGQIAIISSIAGKFGFYLRGAYSASKHALHGYYESLRLEQEKNGIGVTLICPGKINTPISMNALNAEGEAHGKMDHNQATGMSAEKCAEKILDGIARQKREVFIGGKEIWAVYIKRWFPGLFHKIIRKQSATG